MIIRNIKVWILMAMLCVLLAGCQSGKDVQKEAQKSGEQTESISGKQLEYREETLPLPEEVSKIAAMREIDGTFWLVTDQGLYQSDDAGDTWEKNGSFPADNGSVAAVSALGTVAYRRDTGEIILWQEDGEEKELHPKLPQICYKMEFLTEDQLLLTDTASNIEVLNTAEDASVGTLSADEGYHYLVTAVCGQVMVWDGDRVKLYDTTFEAYEECELAAQLFKKNLPEGTADFGIAVADMDNTGFFYAGRTGLLHYTLGGSVSEELMDGAGKAMGDNHYGCFCMAPLSEDSFVVAYMDYNSDGGHVLKRYAYRTEEEAEALAELTLYTLYDSRLLRQEISTLMQEHPEYSVSIEVGVTGENGVTREDAVKTLNTELLAGSGPDLLILDRMSVDSYMEKGMLEDLTEVLERVDKEEGVYRKVTDAYKMDDAVMAIPARFSMPILVGSSEDLADITDLDSLVEKTEALKNQNPDMVSIFGLYDEALLEALFDICAPSWTTENTVDAEAVKAYLEAAGRIQELQRDGVDEADVGEIALQWEREYGYDDAEIDWPFAITNGYQSLAIYPSRSLNFSKALLVLGHEAGLDFTYAEGQSEKVFLPMEIISVNCRSEKAEQAKAFAGIFLSSGCQKQFTIEDCGYPVNRTAFNLLADSNVDEESVASWRESGYDISAETFQSGFERIAEMADGLDTVGIIDETFKNIVIEQGMTYLNGGQSSDEAAERVVQSLELRLSE